MYRLSAVSIDNTIIVSGSIMSNCISHDFSNTNNTGGYNSVIYYNDEVYQFNVTSKTWKLSGTLQQARGFHAMAVINKQDIVDYCN